MRSSRTRSKGSRWLPEGLQSALSHALSVLWGGGVIVLAIGFALALVSYRAEDPSFNTASSSQDVLNWMGFLGSYVADLAWQIFGAGGLVGALVMAAWGWRIVSGRGLDFLVWRVVATLGAMFAIAFVFSTANPTLSLGGALGHLLGQGLSALLPIWARYVVVVILVALGLVSFYIACALTFSEWQIIARTLQNVFLWGIDQLKEKFATFMHLLRSEETGVVETLEEEKEIISQAMAPLEISSTHVAASERLSQEKKKLSEPVITKKTTKAPLIKRPAASARQARLALTHDRESTLPSLELLQWPESARSNATTISEEALEKNAKLLESVLGDFGVNGSITKVSPGPVVTLYELEPAPGTRASRVISLADDIARNMSAASVRVAVVPGRNVIGIELPNSKRETVYLRELLSAEAYNDTRATLPLVLGKDIAGQPVIADLARMPHLLIAGTTGSGKSVAINTMILSLLYRLPPQKCRFIMIDPKMLELSVYEGIPHLLAPVVTEPKKAIMALRWTVREMEERYRAMSKVGVRNIEGYNMRLREAAKNGENLTRMVQTGFDRETGKPVYEEQPLDLTELPFIVVIVDEMADLMIVAGKEIEGAIQRLAQMARAAGIHIMMATQRPSVDVITGTIKANFPTRISFQVTSKIDSRTILGEQGAEQLLGQGDMLYMAGGGRITRVHGPFVRDDEVESIVKFLKSQGEPEYLDEVTEDDGRDDFGGGTEGGMGANSGDELYDKAVDIVLRERKASTSFIQRQLQLGYNKAATLIERMEREGIISSANAVGKREIFGRKPDED